MKKIAIIGNTTKDQQELINIVLENRFDIELVSFDCEEVKQRLDLENDSELIEVKLKPSKKVYKRRSKY